MGRRGFFVELLALFSLSANAQAESALYRFGKEGPIRLQGLRTVCLPDKYRLIDGNTFLWEVEPCLLPTR